MQYCYIIVKNITKTVLTRVTLTRCRSILNNHNESTSRLVK